MLRLRPSILLALSLGPLAAWNAFGQVAVPPPSGAPLPNIRASIEDGFFVLAEQQALGVLRSEVPDEEKAEAARLLAHALWGQKRSSELLDLADRHGDVPGFAYWRARALFELKRHREALAELDRDGFEEAPAGYAPAALRLKAHLLRATGQAAAAEAACLEFARRFPDHRDRVQNRFDLAGLAVRQGKVDEAIARYEALAAEQDPAVSQRAQLRLANLLHSRPESAEPERARALLSGLATNAQSRLAYRIDAYVELAALEQGAGRPAESEAAMRGGIALSPDARQRVPLKLALARMLLGRGDADGALKLLEECRTEAPNETIAAELQLEKGGALLEAKRFREAAEAYQIYLDVAGDPAGIAKASFGRGLALLQLERYPEAATTLFKASQELASAEARAEALFKAADASYRAGRFDEAEARYRAFVAGFPDHDGAPNARYQLGLAQIRSGRRDDALATFSAIEKDHPSSPFAEQAALRTADVMLAGEQWEAALEKFTQIGQTYTNGPTVSLSLHQRGLVLYQLGRHAQAQQAFEAVAADHPQSVHAPQAAYMRGFCLYLQGQTEEAVKTCLAFIEQYPNSEWTPEVIFWLAEQYFNQGGYAEAEPLFLRIAENHKGHRLAPRALYWAGRSAAAQSNYVRAIERYSEVAKNHPGSEILPQTRFAQGDALTELGEFARAILAFEEIIKNYPASHLVNAAWGRKGDCQFSLAAEAPSRYAEAINSYQMILDRPTASLALKLQAEYKVGRCLERMNQPEKAFSRYMNAVYGFLDDRAERSPPAVLWFTRSAFGAAAIKEKERAWPEAVQVYRRVAEANVPAAEEALRRIGRITIDNWLLFQQAEEAHDVGTDG